VGRFFDDKRRSLSHTVPPISPVARHFGIPAQHEVDFDTVLHSQTCMYVMTVYFLTDGVIHGSDS
jgi:hypothetical protein